MLYIARRCTARANEMETHVDPSRIMGTPEIQGSRTRWQLFPAKSSVRPTCRLNLARATVDSHLRSTLETPISFTLMVHHIVLYKLNPEVTPARVEAMMMNARMQLLKIPEVLSIKCGKRIDPQLPWPFFIAIDFESMDKYAIFREDPVFVKFMEEVIKPNTEDFLVLDFEMDPGKDVRFS